MGLGKAFKAVDGYKTYILASLGVLLSLAGHFWGPITVGGQTIPAQTWQQVWQSVYASGIVAALRHGISKGATS